MRLSLCMCALVLASALLQPADGKKVFTSRRKSGGSNKNNNHRRGGSTQKNPPAPAPATPGRTDTTDSHFLAAERSVSSHGSTNVHNRELGLFQRKPASAPEPPRQPVPQTNGPIGFEKVNSEVQRKSGPPAYPGGPAGMHGSAPNGPPPAYNPGYTPGTGSHGGYDAPPAYPGRPVNAPPVYPGSNTAGYGQRAPGQPASGYPNQQAGYQQSGYPHQAAYPSQSYPGQQSFGYPNSGYPTGSNFGYPNQGFGSNPGGGFGNAHQGGFGGNPYGGSPFGHSNSFSGNSFGYGNNHYGANNFGFSNSPGLFGGSHSSGFGSGLFGGGNNNYGYHKKSRFGGLPIPIPIPIPIPMGMFGGWGGGHSRSHRELDAFLKNQTANPSNNSTTNVYILNNSTVTPCTTDQFIYDTLNVTLISCTTKNCTAIKMFITTNTSGEFASRSAGLTMCLEPNTTFSSFAENTSPIVSDLHRYWIKMCKELVWTNYVANVTENVAENASGKVLEPVANVTVKVSETVLNETVIKIDNATEQVPLSTTPASLANSSAAFISSEENVNFAINSTEDNSTEPINSFCDTFDCSWIEMCIPPVEVVEPCSPPGCNSTKMTHNPCVRIKMCKSPTTPISTFATFNNSITRADPTGDVMKANDVANLTLISYFPSSLPANCSKDSGDVSCKSEPLTNSSQEVYGSTNSSEVYGSTNSSEVYGSTNSSEVYTETFSTNSSAYYDITDATTTASSIIETTSIDQTSTQIPL